MHGEAGHWNDYEAFLSAELLGLPWMNVENQLSDSIYPKVAFKEHDIKDILGLLIYDKKNSHGKVNFCLLERIGQPKWDMEVPNSLLEAAFEYYSKN